MSTPTKRTYVIAAIGAMLFLAGCALMAAGGRPAFAIGLAIVGGVTAAACAASNQ